MQGRWGAAGWPPKAKAAGGILTSRPLVLQAVLPNVPQSDQRGPR